MKKIMSALLCLTLLVTLCFGMTFSAAAAGSAEIDGVTYEWDDEVEFLPPSAGDWDINGGARITGSREEGYTFVDLNSWGANLADTEPWSPDEGWYLYYDIEIESGTMGIRAQWWNCNIGAALVNTLDVEGGGDEGDHLTEGEYVGMLPVSEFTEDFNANLEGEDGSTLDVKWLLNIYVVKGRMSINKMKLVHLKAEPTTTTTEAPTTTTEEPTTTTEADATTTAAGDATTTTAAGDQPAEEEGGLSTGVIIAIVAAAVVVIGGVVGGILLAKKKKTPKA